MAAFKGFSTIFKSNPLKLLSLFFDVLIHLSIAGDNLHSCRLGLLFSSNSMCSSPLLIVLSMDILFVIFAVLLLIVLYRNYKIQEKTQYSSCECPIVSASCVCCKCPRSSSTCYCCGYDLASPQDRETYHQNGEFQNTQQCKKCCNCKFTKREWFWKKYKNIFLHISYDIISIIMGFLYLLGDNLSDDVCRRYQNCAMIHLDKDSCKIMDRRTCNENSCTRTGCNVEGCRTSAGVFLGISTFLNILLLFWEYTSSQSSEDPSVIGVAHKFWMKTFNLLTYVIIFDQTLSGLHASTFYLSGDDGDTCTPATHVVGALIYSASVVAWIIFFVILGYEDGPYKKGCRTGTKSERCQIAAHVVMCILMAIFFIIYIFADVPWPWNCFDEDSKYVRRIALEGRLALLAVSLGFMILFALIYAVCVIIPSMYVQRMGKLALDNSGDIRDMLRNLPTCEKLPFTIQGKEQLSVSCTFEEDATSATYKISFTKNHEDTLCCLTCNTSESGDHVHPENVLRNVWLLSKVADPASTIVIPKTYRDSPIAWRSYGTFNTAKEIRLKSKRSGNLYLVIYGSPETEKAGINNERTQQASTNQEYYKVDECPHASIILNTNELVFRRQRS